MTDKRDEGLATKSGRPGSEPMEDPKSGAGYGDHAPDLEKGDDQGGGEEKSA